MFVKTADMKYSYVMYLSSNKQTMTLTNKK